MEVKWVHLLCHVHISMSSVMHLLTGMQSRIQMIAHALIALDVSRCREDSGMHQCTACKQHWFSMSMQVLNA